MKISQRRSAFTMIELLFVIVILGIVGGFALEAVRSYYEGIYRTGEYTKRVAQADHILEQLSKYFENAISVSIVNLDKDNTTDCYGVPGIDDLNAEYTVAFVAADSDSLRGLWNASEGRHQPGWSEDVLVNDANITAIDANYTIADSVITSLGSSLINSAVFNNDSGDLNACLRFNMNGGTLPSVSGYHRIGTGWTSATLPLLDGFPTHGQRKYLLRTAYAFRVDDNGRFLMYSNFRPWAGERYNTAANRKETLLGEKVAHFYADYNSTDFQNNPDITDRGLVWRLKVCMQGLDANLSDSSYEGNMICRERRVHVRY